MMMRLTTPITTAKKILVMAAVMAVLAIMTPRNSVAIAKNNAPATAAFYPKTATTRKAHAMIPSSRVADQKKKMATRESQVMTPSPPRGGAASVPKNSNHGILRKILQKILSSKKFPWIVCAGLSLYYFALYFDLVEPFSAVDVRYSSDGFCVTGLDMTTEPWSCSQQAGNSHQFAWGIDVLFTVLAMAVPFTGIAATKPSTLAGCLWFGGQAFLLALIILVHGFLHWDFSYHNCNLTPNTHLSARLAKEIFGDPVKAYVFFIFVLTMVDLMGYSNLPKTIAKDWGCGYKGAVTAIAVMSAIVALFVLWLSTRGGDPSVSSFFMISQVLVSVTALAFPNPDTVTPQMGWSFIPPCVVSLLEYLKCAPFLVRWGGHAYYDFFLHLSMIVSLLFGTYDVPEFLQSWWADK